MYNTVYLQTSRLPKLSDENNNEYKQEFTTKTGSLAIQIIK